MTRTAVCRTVCIRWWMSRRKSKRTVSFDSLGLFGGGSIRSGTVAAVIFFRWHIGVARYAACSANPFIRFVENLPFVFVKYHILLYPFIAFIHTVSISGKPVSLSIRPGLYPLLVIPAVTGHWFYQMQRSAVALDPSA